MSSDKEFDRLLKDAVQRQRELGQGYGLIERVSQRKHKHEKVSKRKHKSRKRS